MLSIYLLLLAFFVILTSRGDISPEKAAATMQKVGEAFGRSAEGSPVLPDSISGDAGPLARFAEEARSELGSDLLIAASDTSLQLGFPVADLFREDGSTLSPAADRLFTLLQRSGAALQAGTYWQVRGFLPSIEQASGVRAQRARRLRRQQGAQLAAAVSELGGLVELHGIGLHSENSDALYLLLSIRTRGQP